MHHPTTQQGAGRLQPLDVAAAPARCNPTPSASAGSSRSDARPAGRGACRTRLLPALAVLLGMLGLLNAAPAAAATLVSNLGQNAFGDSGVQTFANRDAQQFTTGANTGSSILSSVSLNFTTTVGTPANLRVELWSANSDGEPDSRLASLTVPSTVSGTTAFAAPPNTKLEPSTSYFVLIYVSTSTTGSYAVTSSSSEDPGGQSGWRIADQKIYLNSGSWSDDTAVAQLSVQGTPPLTVQGLAGTSGTIWSATLTPKDLGGGSLGCSTSQNTVANKCSTAATLSDNDFTVGATTYTVYDVTLRSGNLQLGFDSNSPSTLTGSTLKVGSASFPWANGVVDEGSVSISWSSSGLTWTAGTAVEVSLAVPLKGELDIHNAPPGNFAEREPRPGFDFCQFLGEEVKRLYPECLGTIGPRPEPGPVRECRRPGNDCATGNGPQPIHRQQAPPPLYASLMADVNEWRNDPRYVNNPGHTTRWDRVLLALGEPVSDTSLSPMPASEAQGYANRGWTRWVAVAQALNAVVTGTGGADALQGTANADLLVGLGGADTLSGQGGADELRGGDGDDDLSGGAGRDRFVFFSGETGAKAITDFASGDVIVLKGNGWSSAADIIAGVQAVGTGNYRYTLASGLTVETTNNRSLRTEDFLLE